MNVQSFYPRAYQRVPEGQTNFRGSPGSPPEMQLRRDSQRIVADSLYPQHDIVVSGNEDRVSMDYDGIYFDVNFQRQGQDIIADRYGIDNDVAFRRNSSAIKVDRPGNYNDITANFSPNRISIRSSDRSTDVSIENRGYYTVVKQNGFEVESFPTKLYPGGGWPQKPSFLAVSEYIGMNERTADSLDRWAEGGIDKDDLIRVDRQGQVYTYGGEYT